MAEAKVCPVCGEEKKNLGAHLRMKHPVVADQAADLPAGLANTQRYSLINYNLRPNHSRFGMRAVKMIAAICKVCQDGVYPQDWYASCEHDPWFHEKTVTEFVEDREYADDGSYIVKGRSEKKRSQRMPNLRTIPRSPRHNMMDQVERKRRQGWKYPEELGIAPFCQWADCWSQNIQYRSARVGDYCAPQQFRLATLQANRTAINLGDDLLNVEKTRAQIESVALPRG